MLEEYELSLKGPSTVPGILEPTTSAGFADIHEEDVAAMRSSGVGG